MLKIEEIKECGENFDKLADLYSKKFDEKYEEFKDMRVSYVVLKTLCENAFLVGHLAASMQQWNKLSLNNERLRESLQS